jgi:hypothetical protein
MDSPDNRSPTRGSTSIGRTLIRWLKAALALNHPVLFHLAAAALLFRGVLPYAPSNLIAGQGTTATEGSKV